MRHRRPSDVPAASAEYLAWLEEVRRLRNDTIHTDIFMLPHHGSESEHHHPHVQAIAHYLREYKGRLLIVGDDEQLLYDEPLSEAAKKSLALLNWEDKPAAAVREVSSPEAAQKLLALILPLNRVEEALGDFEEGFRRAFERHGKRFPYFWYWWQVSMIASRRGIEALSPVLTV